MFYTSNVNARANNLIVGATEARWRVNSSIGICRSLQTYCAKDDRGLVHQGHAQGSNRARTVTFKATVLARYQRSSDFFICEARGVAK